MSTGGLLVGRGIADITGEAAGCGLLGYGMADQQSEGIHTRQRARAFVFAGTGTHAGDQRILLVVCDLPLVFDSLVQEVLRRLEHSHGSTYTATNTMITATHTHCGAGGYAHHPLYNSNTRGFRPKTFAALVDGIDEAVTRAHRDLAPASLRLVHGELTDASVNRSRIAFDRNPSEERSFFPDAIDPQTTVLGIEREGQVIGAINWFPVHCTSMTNRNRLLSADNKGYAAYLFERVDAGVDYLADLDGNPDFVAAFAQTNAGDMSPNLDLAPGHGPTDDEVENTRLIGTRQHDAVDRLLAGPGRVVEGPLDARHCWIDLGRIAIEPDFSPDAESHRTSGPHGAASSFAGAGVDGPAFPAFKEGTNRLWDLPSRLAYRLSPSLADSQAPKGIVLPGSLLNRLRPIVAERVAVQLIRLGPLFLIGIPGEVTIMAGLRLRRTVAAIVDADLHDVLVAGYSNGYIHYVTTPEEYDAQRYEGGSTLFGRWELAALCQTAARLARAMVAAEPVDPGPPTEDLARHHRTTPRRGVPDEPIGTRRIGDVLDPPRSRYQAGERVTVAFVGAHLANDLHRGGTFLEVQVRQGEEWVRAFDDGDWSTRIHWQRVGRAGSRVTITWDIPIEADEGTYRIVLFGDALEPSGTLRSFEGRSTAFVVSNADPA